MAKKINTWLTDDFEEAAGREVVADQTVEFSLDGKDYEIDLSDKNAIKMRNDVEKWAQSARQISGRKRTVMSGTRTPRVNGASGDGMDPVQRKACRDWLRNNTEEWKGLGDRGRIPEAALEVWNSRAVAQHSALFSGE